MKNKQKKFLIFVGSLKAGGAERVAAWLAREFTVHGHVVTLLTYSPAVEDFYELPSSVRRESVGHTEGHSTFAGKLLINVRRCLKVRRLLKEMQIDTVLALMPHESVVAILAGVGLQTRVVVSERNAPWHRRQDRIWSLLRNLVYRFADAQVAQTDLIGEWLRKHTGSRRVHIIPNAVQHPLTSAAPPVNPLNKLPAGKRVLLAAGTKPWQKGFDLLLDAFSLIAATHPEWILVIPGLLRDRVEEGLSGNDLMKKAQQNGIGDRVFMPGQVGNMADWYRIADIFVLSSRFEGFPNVLLEAMSEGLPCIAYDCETGPREIITNDVNGILINSIEVESMAAGISRLMSDDQLRSRLGGAAKDVCVHYSSDRVLQLWSEVLHLKNLVVH